MSIRIKRINSEMAKSLSVIISHKVKDPRIPAMVSVTKVDCATDLKTAKVFVSSMGSGEEKQAMLAALVNSGGFIRSQLAIDFKAIRTVPQLTFFIDESSEYGCKIDAILNEIKKEEA